MLDRLAEIAVGAQVECDTCGQTLIRRSRTDVLANDFVEVSSDEGHQCWTQLPEEAEHLRLD